MLIILIRWGKGGWEEKETKERKGRDRNRRKDGMKGRKEGWKKKIVKMEGRKERRKG